MKGLNKKTIYVILIIIILVTMVPTKKVRADSSMANITFNIGLEDCRKSNSTIPGDVNLDGLVTDRDVAIISRFVSNEEVWFNGNAQLNVDVNQDGKTTATDAMLASQYASGKRETIGVNNLMKGQKLEMMAYDCSESVYGEKIQEGLTWSSSDENIATVDEDGTVTAISKGDVTIKADNGTYYDEVVLHIVENTTKETGTGVTLEGTNILKEDTSTTVYLTVDNTGMENELAGFSASIENVFNYQSVRKSSEPTINVITDGWELTAQNQNSSVETYFSIERKDIQSVTDSNSVKVAITFDIPNVEGENLDYGIVEITGSDTFTRTDENGNANNPLDSTLQLILVEEEYTPTVKAGYENNVTINGKDIYIKMDGAGTSCQTYFSQLFKAIDFGNNNNFYTWYSLEGDVDQDDSDGKVVTGTVDIMYTEGADYIEYNLYVLGDCYTDWEGININDVMYLRQAIVKNSEVLNSDDFCVKTTDVNGSNMSSDGTRNLGDIGDVILIRKRIIDYKWTNS